MELGSKLIELIAQAPQIFDRAVPEQRRELVGLLTSDRGHQVHEALPDVTGEA